MNVGRNPLQVSSLLPQSAMANLYKWLVSVVLVLVSVSVTQISSEKVARATSDLSLASGNCNQTVTGTLVYEANQVGSDCVVQFISGSGTWTPREDVDALSAVLVVGGGGGGGQAKTSSIGAGEKGGGGGGAGGYLERTSVSVVGAVQVTVGLGGVSPNAASGQGAQGQGSLFGILTVGGGGGGGGVAGSGSSACPPTSDRDGVMNGGSPSGSGGGGAGLGWYKCAGFKTGSGFDGLGEITNPSGSGGGGGGAGAKAENVNQKRHIGGAGKSSSITGETVAYGVGGSGATPAQMTAPTANSSFGGGGSGSASFSEGYKALSGNAGIVIVRYALPFFDVTFDAQDGTAVEMQRTTRVDQEPSTTLEGFEFQGWFDSVSGGSEISFPYSPTSNVTLFAQWTISTYAVSFNGNNPTGGSVPDEETKTDGIDIAVASNSGSLVKTGYTFGGWNTAANGSGTSYLEGAWYGVDAAVTLFAKWTADSLTVTYNSQGGSAVSTGSSVSGGSITSAPVVSTRAGYVFTGWFTATSGGTAITFPYTHSQTTSFTLHAQWTISTYAVSFNSNGSTGGSVPDEETKTDGIDIAVASNSGSLVKTGYTFDGWNTVADGSGTSYLEGAWYGVDAAVTLFAKWTADSLTVTYNSQGGSAVSTGSSVSGGSITSAPVVSTRAGYVFTGWFTATSGGTAITFPYTHSQTTSFTLHAQWTISTYAVSFNSNGSTGGSVPGPQTKTDGINLTLASNTGSLVKTGYTFDGWNTVADGSGTSYAEGASYGVDAAVTLYAKWTADSLTVTYNSQSGSEVSAGSSVSGGSITSAPVVPTRAGYVFTGWFTATSGGTAITFPYTHSQTTSFTLYAQWSQASLYGLGSVTNIGFIRTTENIGNTFSVDTETSSVSLRYLANGLPADSVIDVYLVNDLSRARSLIVPAGGFVVSLVVAWLAADGSVPLMASGKPLSMTIANDTIKAGAKTYAIVGGEVTLLGTATVDGTVTISITQDPEIVVVNPAAVVSQPSATPATPASPATESRPSSRPVVAPVTEVRNVPSRVASLLPKVLGATSKIAAILNTVVGQLPPQPMVFAPKLSSNGTVIRVVFKPVVLKAPPVDAPVAPMGAKVIPIGSMIEQSKETPVAPVSKVGAGESKATFGGKTIETALETSLDGAAVLSAGPATIALAGFTSEPASSNGGASTSSGLTASSSTPLEIATGSFIASTPVQVWLFSTPMLLAETSVDENGNFAAAINLPSSLPAGNHTLQIQGFVYTASGAAEVTANIGVSVAAASVGVKWTSTFPLYVASISPSVRARWTTFVSGQASPTLQCTITGIRPQRNSKANIRLFENRQIALTTLLKYNGCVSIETKTQISATKSSVENRTWKVEVQSKATAVAFRWVHDYKTYSSTITTKQKTQWDALVEKYAGQKLSCAITGAEPLRNSSANTIIFNNRNESLKTYLLKNGCSTVQINSPISKNIKIATRTKWKVEVSTSN